MDENAKWWDSLPATTNDSSDAERAFSAEVEENLAFITEWGM